MADSMVIHRLCTYILVKGTGIRCNTHNVWVYKYKWQSNKAENYKSHYWKVSALAQQYGL